MKMNNLRLFILILTFVRLCNFSFAADKKPDYWPTEGWKTASPESQGMESNLLLKMLDTIWEKDIAIDSVLIVRNGYLVLDAYGYPFGAENRRHIHSCSKSITSAMVGIAIDKGYIQDVSQPVLDFFPKRHAKNLDTGKKAVTLENLLTMTSGLKCRDSYLYNWSGLSEMSRTSDWIQFMLDLPMEKVPGAYFEYCNGASYLVSVILQKQTGMDAFSFAEKNLFAPLGISDVHWTSNSRGITIGFNGLHMRPHDMAKIGFLYLNNGLWDGKRIITSQWIQASTRKHIATHSDYGPGYGYQWWIVDPGIYTAIGYKGQYIMVVPEKNMLVVFTGSLSREDISIPFGLLASYIIPTVKSPTPLPKNPNGSKALKSIATLWQNTGPMGRQKIEKKAEKTSRRLEREAYVNNEYGFSVNYDAELILVDNQLESPFVFRRRGLRGLPVFTVLVDDIPRGMALENTADYMIDLYKIIFPKTYHKTYHHIKKEELIELSDGTAANYVEIIWKIQPRGTLTTVGVYSYKNSKIIGAVAGTMEEAPIEYLAGIAKSLKFIE